MKKLAHLAIATALASTFAFAGVPAFAASAAGGTVQGDATNILQWQQSQRWVDEGLEFTVPQWQSGGFRMFFDVSEEKSFSMKFKMPIYEEDSSNFIVEDKITYCKNICDLIVKNMNNGQTAQLRLWGDSGANPNDTNISAQISLGEPYDAGPVADNVWVKGVMRASSEFYFEFDTTNIFSGYWGNDEDLSVLLDNGSVKNGAETKTALAAAFADCEAIQVYLRLSKNDDPDTADRKGRCVITEVNGQSLANENGELVDTQAPYLAPLKVRLDAEITQGKEYRIEVKGSPYEGATQSLYCDYASDVLGYQRLTYTVTVTGPSGTARTFADLEEDAIKIMFDEEGANQVTVTATDLGGNSYTTPGTTIDVVHGFLLTVEGVPETGIVGKKITLPAGTATDSQDNACDVTIGIEDPYAKAYTIKDGGFTPDKPGVWYVKYSAQNADGTEQDSKTFRITVTAAPTESTENPGDKNEKQGCSGSLTVVGGISAGLIVVAAAAIILISKKKKN